MKWFQQYIRGATNLHVPEENQQIAGHVKPLLILQKTWNCDLPLYQIVPPFRAVWHLIAQDAVHRTQ